MSLPPGTCVGPYEVVAPIGAGGMGEVYRARDPRRRLGEVYRVRDTKLERDVAIKVLSVRGRGHRSLYTTSD